MEQRGPGAPEKWISPARNVLTSAGTPLHIRQIRDGVESLGTAGGSSLQNGTLYSSLNSHSDFVRVANRRAVFGLAAWYTPVKSLERVRALLDGNPGEIEKWSVTRDVEDVIDCDDRESIEAALLGLQQAAAARGGILAGVAELSAPERNAVAALLDSIAMRFPDLLNRVAAIKAGQERSRRPLDGEILGLQADPQSELVDQVDEIDVAVADLEGRLEDVKRQAIAAARDAAGEAVTGAEEAARRAIETVTSEAEMAGRAVHLTVDVALHSLNDKIREAIMDSARRTSLGILGVFTAGIITGVLGNFFWGLIHK